MKEGVTLRSLFGCRASGEKTALKLIEV